MFDTPHGPMALVLVGPPLWAAYHGVASARSTLPPARCAHGTGAKRDTSAAQGRRWAASLGSTVVMLWPKSANLRFNPFEWAAARPVRLGEYMAKGDDGLTLLNAWQQGAVSGCGWGCRGARVLFGLVFTLICVQLLG